MKRALMTAGPFLALFALLIGGGKNIIAAQGIAGPSEVAKQKAPPFLLPQPAAVAGGSVVFAAGGGIAGTAPVPVHSPYRLPRDGTIQNMRILIQSKSLNGPAVVTLFVNGTATVLSATIPAGSTADIDVPDTVTVLDGQRVDLSLDTSAASTPPAVAGIFLTVSYEIV